MTYPASEASEGYYGVVPTMRLKAIRDGLQDVDYLELAETYGIGSAANTEAQALITAYGTWDTDESNYDAARVRLGAMLALGNRNPPAAVRRVPGTDTVVRRVAGADTVVRRVSAADGVIRRV